MRSYGEEMTTSLVDPTDNEIGADVTLVLEEVLFEHSHGRYDLRFATCRKGMELDSRDDVMISHRMALDHQEREDHTSMLLLMRLVTNSVSAAVPAPQHLMWSAM